MVKTGVHGKDILYNINKLTANKVMKSRMTNRLSKTEYYLGIAKAVCKRSTCLRRKYGAVIVKDDTVLCTSYNGAPRGAENCNEIGKCLRADLKGEERYEVCRGLSAEENIIVNAARKGVSIIGGTLYVYGEDTNTEKVYNARLSNVSKKLLSNSGLEEIIIKKPKGEPERILVELMCKSP